MASPNSIKVRKCRGHQQATRRFGVFSFIPPPLILELSLPISFTKKILPSSRLSEVRHDLGSILEMLIITWCDDSGASTTWTKNTSLVGPGEKYLIPIPPFGVVQKHGMQAGSQSYLVCKFDEEFRDSLRGFTCAISVSAQH